MLIDVARSSLVACESHTFLHNSVHKRLHRAKINSVTQRTIAVTEPDPQANG